MDAHAELEQLLAEMFDRPPDAARNEKLQSLLHAHPELQGPYLEQMQLHAMLQWRSGRGTAATQLRSDTEPAAAASQGRGWRSRRALAAVLLFTAASLGFVMFIMLPEAQAGPDLVEHLVDWNLDLALVPRLEERDQLYVESVVGMKATLATAKLSKPDRSLADTLMENSSWLVRNDDPVAKAKRFNEIADMLVDRLNAVTSTTDEKRIEKLAHAYRRLAEHGVDTNVNQALAQGPMDGDKTKTLEQVLIQDEKRAKKIEQIIEKHPEPGRAAIRRGMKGFHLHRGKKLLRTNK